MMLAYILEYGVLLKDGPKHTVFPSVYVTLK